MSLLIGTKTPQEIWLGNNEIKQLYLGNNLIWERIPDVYEPWILDVGTADGVTWTPQAYANPNSYGIASCADQTTKLRIYISQNSSSTINYGNSWSTTNTIRIPRDASTLNIRINKGSGYYIGNYCFGLLLPEASDWKDITNGGVISSTLSVPSGTTIATPSITIPESMRGSNDYKIVIGFWGLRNTAKELLISRVWFE